MILIYSLLQKSLVFFDLFAFLCFCGWLQMVLFLWGVVYISSACLGG